jgi:hypothetical protein
VAGAAILAFPELLDYGISTGIHVHNLDNLGIGFFIVIFAVVIIGAVGYVRSMKNATRLYKVVPPSQPDERDVSQISGHPNQ